MNKLLLTLGLGLAGTLLPLSAAAANLAAPAIDPVPNTYPYGEGTYMPGDINQITFTWQGADLEIAKTTGIKIEDWTFFENSFNEEMLSVDGETVTLTYTFATPDTYDIYIPAGCFLDKNTQNTNAAISIQYLISAMAVTEEWFTSSPSTMVDIAELGPTVTYTLTQGNKISTAPSTSDVKYTNTPFASIPLNQWDTSVTSTLVEVSNVTRANSNKDLVIDLGTTLTEAGWYGIRIMDYSLQVETDTEDADNVGELWYWYKVSGYSISPKNGASFAGSYPGLTIAGANVNVSSPASIIVYSGYIDESSTAAEKNTATKVGSGGNVTDTTLDDVAGKLISFNYTEDIYNGSYTIEIPANAVTVNYKSVGPLYWHFTITDSTKPLPEVASNPDEGLVSSLKTVQVKWGEGEAASSTVSTDFYGCPLEATGNGGVTLTLPSGQQASGVSYSKVDVTENPNDLETPTTLGSYVQIQTDGYEIPGKYVLTIAANTYNVIIDSANIVPNEEVNLTFEIEGKEMENEAEVLNPTINGLVGYPAVELSWGETVYVADADALQLPVSYGGQVVGTLTSKYINLVPGEANQPGVDLLAETGNGGDIMYLLVSSAGLIDEDGVYSVQIPANIVYNDEGAFNKAQTVTFTIVNELAKGTVSPESGAKFEEGKNVTITITYDSAPEANAEVEEPLLVTDMIDGGYEERFDWTDDVLSIEGNSVVINLGNDLTAGTYYVSFKVEAVTVDGMSSEELEYQFVVTSDAPVVNYLEAEATVVPDSKADAVSPFETISISWSGYNLTLNDDNEISATFNGEPVSGLIEDNALTFEVDGTEEGSYTLVVPQDYVIAINAEGESYYNNGLNLVFVVSTQASSGDLMAPAGLMFENDPFVPALFLYWNEEIEAVGELKGTLVTPTEEEVEVSFAISTYLPGVEEGDATTYSDNALILPMGSYVAQYGSGMYQINVAEGIVEGVTSGKLNAAIVEESFIVAAEPTLSSVVPVVSYNAESDNITIIWENMTVTEYNPNGAEVTILNVTDPDAEPIRLSVGNGVSIAGDMVIVDLSDLGLEVGSDYELVVAAYYFYLGENNEANDEILYEFTYDGTTGISALEAEALKGGVYNLNGVKISDEVKNLKKGVYIINGKKVLVK